MATNYAALKPYNYGTRPIPFNGTKTEVRENFDTHHFAFDGDTGRCMKCDSKDWHAAASYPCGEEPPRELFDPATGLTIPDYEGE